VIIPRQVLASLFHDDPAIFDDIAPINGFQTLSHILFGDEQGNFFFNLF
jgi:hypothetical protein